MVQPVAVDMAHSVVVGEATYEVGRGTLCQLQVGCIVMFMVTSNGPFLVDKATIKGLRAINRS